MSRLSRDIRTDKSQLRELTGELIRWAVKPVWLTRPPSLVINVKHPFWAYFYKAKLAGNSFWLQTCRMIIVLHFTTMKRLATAKCSQGKIWPEATIQLMYNTHLGSVFYVTEWAFYPVKWWVLCGPRLWPQNYSSNEQTYRGKQCYDCCMWMLNIWQ